MKRLPAAFYALPSGLEPVREWLRGLSLEDRKRIGEDIKDVELSWPIGMPLCRPLGAGLWRFAAILLGVASRESFFFAFKARGWCSCTAS